MTKTESGELDAAGGEHHEFVADPYRPSQCVNCGRSHAARIHDALAAPVDHPEVVGVKELQKIAKSLEKQARKLRNLAALRPSDSPALDAGVAVTDAMVERASAEYAKETGYYVEFHRGLRSESSDKIRRGIKAALRAALSPTRETGK